MTLSKTLSIQNSRFLPILVGVSLVLFLASVGITFYFRFALEQGLVSSLHVSIGQVLGAITLATIGIFVYVSARFRSLGFGIGALLALLYDFALTLAVISLSGLWFGTVVDITVIIALIAVLSFSIHDTLIVYDHVREHKKKITQNDFLKVVMTAIDATWLRSFRSSLVLVLILISLVLFGPESLHLFSAVLLVGVISGAYSSLGVAVPVILAIHKIERKILRRQ